MLEGTKKSKADIRMRETKKKQKTHLEKYYDNLQNQGEEGLLVKVQVTQAFDNEKSHGIIYTKRSKLIYLENTYIEIEYILAPSHPFL